MSEELKLSAVNFGFDATWVADFLQKYGQDALALAVEAARNGFSASMVTEILTKFGPDILQFLISLQNNTKVMGMTAPTGMVDVKQMVLFDTIQQHFGAGILQNLITKYGPQIAQILIQIFLSNLKK